LHFDGKSWSPQPSPTGKVLRSVFGLAADDISAGGDIEMVRFDVGAWRLDNPIILTTERFLGMHGADGSAWAIALSNPPYPEPGWTMSKILTRTRGNWSVSYEAKVGGWRDIWVMPGGMSAWTAHEGGTMFSWDLGLMANNMISLGHLFTPGDDP
jgi:hypothetical protein